MDEHEARRRIQRALDPGPGFPGPMLWERTVSRLDEPAQPRRGPRQALALAAAVLCAAAVAGALVLSRSVERRDVPASGVTATHCPAMAPPPGPGSAAYPFVPAARCPAGQWPAPTSTRPGKADYQFVSATAGWLVEYEDGGTAHILRTGDGGAHWTAAGSLTGVPPHSTLRFFDDHEGLVIADGPSGSGVRVSSTTDGGAHWRAADGSGSIGVVSSTWFATMTEGWLLSAPRVGFPISVFHTTDGGQRWALVGDPATQPLLAGLGVTGAIEFSTLRDGWIVGVQERPGIRVLLATHDGGRTWSSVVLPAPPDRALLDGRVQGALPTFDGADGLMLANYTNQNNTSPMFPYLYATHDGGLTWSCVRTLDEFAVTFQDVTHWARERDGGVELSGDAGQTWSAPRPLPELAGWYGARLSFIGSNGWLILQQPVPGSRRGPAPRYAILVTTDGGVHWTDGRLPPA